MCVYIITYAYIIYTYNYILSNTYIVCIMMLSYCEYVYIHMYVTTTYNLLFCSRNFLLYNNVCMFYSSVLVIDTEINVTTKS